jgi:hypothetical protein
VLRRTVMLACQAGPSRCVNQDCRRIAEYQDTRTDVGEQSEGTFFSIRSYSSERHSRRYLLSRAQVPRRPFLAHCRDGGRPSWWPVVGVVLPPLWHQGHTLCPGPERSRTAVENPRDSGSMVTVAVAAAAVSAAISVFPKRPVELQGDAACAPETELPGL